VFNHSDTKPVLFGKRREGQNGINELWCQFHQHLTQSFIAWRSQKRKNTVKQSVFFAFLGSVCLKAGNKMLVKFTRCVNFIIVLSEPFLYKSLYAAFLYLCFSFVIFWRQNFIQKMLRKTLMKLTRERKEDRWA